MRRWRIDGAALRLAAALLLGVMVLAPGARSDPRAVAESRFFPARLARVGDYFQGEVAAGHIPGAGTASPSISRPSASVIRSRGRR
jgi:hypothetical protein